jgi:hypothetical protein
MNLAYAKGTFDNEYERFKNSIVFPARGLGNCYAIVNSSLKSALTL